MNIFLILILGIAIGLIIARNKKWPTALVERQAEEKADHRRKILGFFDRAEGKPVRNNDIQGLLGVSDATATRYLEDIEQEGLIRQVGETGHDVFYEKI